LLWDEPAIYFGLRRGVNKNGKQNHAQEKKEKKLVHNGAWENVYVSPISGICLTGMLERKFSYF